MKVRINYDLLNKIREAKIGIALDRTARNTLVFSSLLTLFQASMIFLKETPNPLREIISEYAKNLLFYTVFNCGLEIMCSHFTKNNAENTLRQFSKTLKEVNVNTNYELLLKAYIYSTKYHVEFDESRKLYLKQDKYIMVPVIVNGEEKEVSLIQEHVIGTRDYDISYGSPQKKLKLAYNPT